MAGPKVTRLAVLSDPDARSARPHHHGVPAHIALTTHGVEDHLDDLLAGVRVHVLLPETDRRHAPPRPALLLRESPHGRPSVLAPRDRVREEPIDRGERI